MFKTTALRIVSQAAAATSKANQIKEMGKKSVYAVVRGRRPGLYRSWDDCNAQVSGFKGNLYQGFQSDRDALQYLRNHGVAVDHVEPPSNKRSREPHPYYEPLDEPAEYQPDTDYQSVYSIANLLAEQQQKRQQQQSMNARAAADYQRGLPSMRATAAARDFQPTTHIHGSRNIRVEFDGVSKNNPGPAGYGAVLYDADTGEELQRLYQYMGDRYTNNQAEYAGLIAGLQAAKKMGCKSVVAQGDSLLVINQVLGTWKVKNEGLMPYHQQAVALSREFKFKARQVPRAENAVADELSNIAIQQHRQGVQGNIWQAPTEFDAEYYAMQLPPMKRYK